MLFNFFLFVGTNIRVYPRWDRDFSGETTTMGSETAIWASEIYGAFVAGGHPLAKGILR